MTGRLGSAVVAFVLAAFLGGAGCAKKEKSAPPPPEKGPDPISVNEEKRGATACADFKKKVCACSAEHPTDEKLALDCKLADSRTEALSLSARISATENSSAADRTAAVNNGRRIVKKCIEATAKLAIGCGLDPTQAEPPETDKPKKEPAQAP